MSTVSVALKERSYPVVVGVGVARSLGRMARTLNMGRNPVVVTNATVWRLHGETILKALRCESEGPLVLSVADSETSKSLSVFERLIDRITRWDRKKKPYLIAFGGGVVGDLTGFIASVYKRGILFVQVPTTLLAQIDASVGGKTGIDTRFGKNMIGTFYQPKAVVCDVGFLKTLSDAQMKEGMAEAIKYGMICDPELFGFIENNSDRLMEKDVKMLSWLVHRCAAIKADIVSRDERDKTGVRMILNFGHTLGHAIESASRYRVSHGNAVAVGMVFAARLSCERKLMSEVVFERLKIVLKKAGLPVTIPTLLSDGQLIKCLPFDKKFGSHENRFVLARGIGQTKIVEDVPREQIRKVLSLLRVRR